MAKDVGVIIAAAGKSSRFGQPHQKKPFVLLQGRPVWQFSAELFRNRKDVGPIVLVVSPEDREMVEDRYAANLLFCNVNLVEGGAERVDSVARGLEALGDQVEYVAVHDAARPCVQAAAIDRCVSKAREIGAAILATPVTSTVKQRKTDGTIERTIDRRPLWLAQTPQIAKRTWLGQALAQRTGAAPTDEAEALERIGKPVAIVEGDATNLKLTTSDDMTLIKAILGDRPKAGLDALFG